MMSELSGGSQGGRGRAGALAAAGVTACIALCVARAALAEDGSTAGESQPPRTIDAECPVCRGDGLLKEIGCSRCRAVGYVNTNSCKSCSGSGRVQYSCPYCKGSGELSAGGRSRECPGCKGKGSLACLACQGKGTIEKPNPEAAGGPTSDCAHCTGTGFEQNETCRRCGGKGTLTLRSGRSVDLAGGQRGNDREREEPVTVDCPFCDGKGKAPPLCRVCHGRGYAGSDSSPRPCAACFATGRQFLRCRACAGRGWTKAAK